MKNALLLLILFQYTFAWGDSLTCDMTGQVFPMGMPNSELTKFTVELNRHNSIAAAQKDFKGFCEWNRMDRVSGELASYYRTAPSKLRPNNVGEFKILIPSRL